ncbi:MAG TPA: hypothetical protein VLX68_11525 [Chitinivibrionales bacterium]|nr:hypothetical protein [Chitinivibrionales bacterium]
MSQLILCACKKNIIVFEEKKTGTISSLFIEQYCRNQQQVVSRRKWSHEGFGAAFRMDMRPGMEFQEVNVMQSARITGITPVDGGDIIYSCAVGDSSGLFRCRPGDDIDNEGHVLHDRNVLFEGVTATPDGRMAFSIRNKNGECNIAVGKTGSSQYREVTEGDSIDRNPAWDPANPDLIYYDSASIGYENNGRPVIGPRAILKIELSKGEIEEILGDDNLDYFSPQADSDGNIWCIRRPYAKSKTPVMTFFDVLLVPVRIGKAVFHAIEFFTYRNTGETLTSAGPNPGKIRTAAPEDLFLEGVRIDSKKNLRENSRAGELIPGIISRSWELVRMDPNGDIVCVARGVCSFALTGRDSFVFSNGRYVCRSERGKVERIGECGPPCRIAVM